MSKVWQLAVAFLREHPARVVITTLATMAATCMVVWVAAGYDSLLQSFDTWANVALGHYELSIAPISQEAESGVPVEVLNAMREDPAIASADPFWVQSAIVKGISPTAAAAPTDAIPPTPAGPPNLRSEYTVIASTIIVPPFAVSGQWLQDSHADEAVIRADIAQRLHVGLNDNITIQHRSDTFTLRVVGLLQAPTLGIGQYGVPNMLTPSTGDVFVSTELAQEIFQQPPVISFVGVAMKPEADITKFRFSWAPKLSHYPTAVQFQEAYEIEEWLDESAAADNVRLQSYAASGIAMLVSMLVIFSTVNMGVTERVRQFAILRAVVLTRSQLCLLIFAEGLLLATIGCVGGLVISWLMLSAVARSFSGLLHHGAIIGPRSVLLAGVATYGGAILATAVPAWRATHVRPVDAMVPRPQSVSTGALPWRTITLGLLLILVNPILTFVFPPRVESRVIGTMVVGFVTLSIGAVLLAPVVVALVDRWLSAILARCIGIDPQLIASQLTSHLWRTATATISLAIGLGLYISIQVWGFTMLDAFIVGPWAPDAVLAFDSPGLRREHVAEFQQIEGIRSEQCLPIWVEQPRLLEDITGSAERASVTRQDNVVLVGLDPEKGFGGQHPLFNVEWAEGDPVSAVAAMMSGRACLVPDHFLTESGLKLGDSFELVPPEDSDHPRKYTIAGALKLPGWHWQTKLTGFRSRTHRAAALVFANDAFVSQDFGLKAATHLWLNFSHKAVDPERIVAQARQLYDKISPAQLLATASTESSRVRIMPVEQIRQMTRRNAGRWIWAISQLPLIAVLISGLGVLNVILASIRSRQWELGVLRSIGITQSAIIRAILLEGLLIGVAACLLSLGFGILAGWCGCGIAQHMSFFGGLHPQLHVPWFATLLGVMLVVVVTTLAGLWPALSIGRKPPLALLQQGQSSF